MKTLFVVVALLTSPKEQAVVFNHLYSSCDVAIYKLKQKHDLKSYMCITEYHWRKWHQNKTSGEWLQWFNG